MNYVLKDNPRLATKQMSFHFSEIKMFNGR